MPSKLHPLRVAFYRAGQGLNLRLFSTKRVIHGMPCWVIVSLRGVSVWQSTAAVRAVIAKHDQVVFDRIEAALQLLEVAAPRILRRFCSDVRRIVVIGDETNHDATYDPILGYVFVTDRFAESEGLTAARFARLLVHEATHARIDHVGIPYEVGTRARIERACVKQELAFVRSVSDEPQLTAETEARVARWARLGEDNWSDERFRRDAVEQMDANIRPRWLARMLGRMLGLRAA